MSQQFQNSDNSVTFNDSTSISTKLLASQIDSQIGIIDQYLEQQSKSESRDKSIDDNLNRVNANSDATSYSERNNNSDVVEVLKESGQVIVQKRKVISLSRRSYRSDSSAASFHKPLFRESTWEPKKSLAVYDEEPRDESTDLADSPLDDPQITSLPKRPSVVDDQLACSPKITWAPSRWGLTPRSSDSADVTCSSSPSPRNEPDQSLSPPRRIPAPLISNSPIIVGGLFPANPVSRVEAFPMTSSPVSNDPSSSLTSLSQSLTRILETEDSEDDFLETSQNATRLCTQSFLAKPRKKLSRRCSKTRTSKNLSIQSLSPIARRLDATNNSASFENRQFLQTTVAKPQLSTVTHAATQPSRTKITSKGSCSRLSSQSSQPMSIGRLPFLRIISDLRPNDKIKFQSNAALALQTAAEEFTSQLLEAGNLAAVHAKRVTIKPEDTKLVLRILDIFPQRPNL